MKRSELKQIIKEEIHNVLKEATVKLGPDKNFVLKSDRKGVNLTKVDPNGGGRVHSEMYIFKNEIPDVINFLNNIKENQNSTINEEFDNRKNKFSSIFLQTFYDMNDNEITFDEASDRLFAWIETNFK